MLIFLFFEMELAGFCIIRSLEFDGFGICLGYLMNGAFIGWCLTNKLELAPHLVWNGIWFE